MKVTKQTEIVFAIAQTLLGLVKELDIIFPADGLIGYPAKGESEIFSRLSKGIFSQHPKATRKQIVDAFSILQRHAADGDPIHLIRGFVPIGKNGDHYEWLAVYDPMHEPDETIH
jgi:hypothetical protein